MYSNTEYQKKERMNILFRTVNEYRVCMIHMEWRKKEEKNALFFSLFAYVSIST